MGTSNIDNRKLEDYLSLAISSFSNSDEDIEWYIYVYKVESSDTICDPCIKYIKSRKSKFGVEPVKVSMIFNPVDHIYGIRCSDCKRFQQYRLNAVQINEVITKFQERGFSQDNKDDQIELIKILKSLQWYARLNLLGERFQYIFEPKIGFVLSLVSNEFPWEFVL